MKLISSPNDFLNKAVKPFEFETMDAKQIAGEMCQIMMAKNGLGLAANQVGLDAQIFVMRPVEHAEVTKPFAVINPVILEISKDTVTGKEGCLSHIGLILNVNRPKRLVAQFLTLMQKSVYYNLVG